MPAHFPTRDALGDFLNALGLAGHGVEVGAYRGDFARQVLARWNGEAWWLLDPWEDLRPEVLLTNNVGWDLAAARRACGELAAQDPGASWRGRAPRPKAPSPPNGATGRELVPRLPIVPPASHRRA